MKKHKYLTDLGISESDIMQNICEPDPKREVKWKKQEEEYGFDDRETWALDISFCQWLYERLMMYKEIAGKVVNLEYYKFDIHGSKMSQIECIDAILELLKPNLLNNNFLDNFYQNDLKEICYIWGKILPAMWW